jgi:hypothetical protein
MSMNKMKLKGNTAEMTCDQRYLFPFQRIDQVLKIFLEKRIHRGK